ncbi:MULTISPECIES: hypothetical protein [Actinosynnema]|uniref:hypothetical protein n=1 Tax=Actinosynnema TaxID=40566 RepID=UPI0020A5862A|nr:hypothetical protein [Actinosynnema pretiosum]MCP2096288.1 hypothetical protein [Actinosynnema pretiosum]
MRHALELASVRRLAAGPAEAREAFAEAVVEVLERQERCALERDLRGFAAADLERLTVLVEEHRGLRGLVVGGDVAGFDSALLAHLAGTHDVAFGLAPPQR